MITNPTQIVITKSPDHDALSFDGVTPKVQGYKVKYFQATEDPLTATPTYIVDVGKPTPTALGSMTITKASVPGLFGPPLLAGVQYIPTAVAYGPGGESAVKVSTGSFVFSDTPAAPTNITVS